MRLMFVDDEERVLQGVARSLCALGVTWDLAFSTSGFRALAELERNPADAVIADIRMAGMDGRELLSHVRTRWPGAFRIMLSSEGDDRFALSSLDVVHQFLAKPCDGIDIVNVVERMYSLRSLLDGPTLRDIVGRAGTLPPTPQLSRELTRCLADPLADAQTVSSVLNRDPALAAKMLHVANYGYFGRGKHIVDLKEAVESIGFDRVRALTLILEVFMAGDRPDFTNQLGRRALKAALLAERIAAGKPFQRESLTAALLCDVGLLIPAIEAHCRCADLRGEGTYTYVEAGAYLLGLWGLSSSIIEAVAFHREPWRVHPREFGAVSVAYVASCLARGINPSEDYLSRCGVLGELSGWKRYADELHEQLTDAGERDLQVRSGSTDHVGRNRL